MTNIKIIFNPDKMVFTNKVFHVSECDVPFATEYELQNPHCGSSMIFKLVKSTGPEFDSKTIWIYEGKHDLSLYVHNDKVKGK